MSNTIKWRKYRWVSETSEEDQTSYSVAWPFDVVRLFHCVPVSDSSTLGLHPDADFCKCDLNSVVRPDVILSVWRGVTTQALIQRADQNERMPNRKMHSLWLFLTFSRSTNSLLCAGWKRSIQEKKSQHWSCGSALSLTLRGCTSSVSWAVWWEEIVSYFVHACLAAIPCDWRKGRKRDGSVLSAVSRYFKVFMGGEKINVLPAAVAVPSLAIF